MLSYTNKIWKTIAEAKNLARTLTYWAILLLLYFVFDWYMVYLPNETILFGDLKVILACGDFEILDAPVKDCDVWIYGRLLHTFLGSLTWLHPFGDQIAPILVACALIGPAALLSRARTIGMVVFTILIFLSPPIALLIQRGNFDLIVFNLIFLSIELFVRRRAVPAILLATFATMMKMYSFPLVIIYGIYIFMHQRALFSRILLMLYLALISWSTIFDVWNIPWLPADARNSFGLPIFGEYLQYLLFGPGSQVPKWISGTIGISSLGIVFLIVRQVFPTSKIQAIKVDREESLWFIAFASIFLAGLSIDYRLVFLIPCFSVYWKFDSRERTVLLLLIGLSYFLSFPFDEIQVLGDISLFTCIVVLMVVFFRLEVLEAVFERKFSTERTK